MTTHLCESPRCRPDPDTTEMRLAAPGLRLCWGCHTGLGRDLDRLPAIWADLEQALTQTGGGGGGPVVSGTRERALPLNVRAAYARTEITPILAAWASLVAYERGMTLPRPDAASTARWLSRHVDWLAAHPAAGDAADEIAEVYRIAVRGAYPTPVRRVDLGACPMAGCTGTVAAIVRDPAAVLPSAAACDTDLDHEWAMAQWPQLRRAMVATS